MLTASQTCDKDSLILEGVEKILAELAISDVHSYTALDAKNVLSATQPYVMHVFLIHTEPCEGAEETLELDDKLPHLGIARSNCP